MSKTRTLLLLSATVLILFGSYFFLKHQSAKKAVQPGETEARPRTVILQLPREKIAKISLKSNRETICLQKNTDQWIAAGMPFDLDQNQVGLLLSSLEQLEAADLIAATPDDLDQYGLASPAVTAEIVLNDQTTRTLYLGNPTPSGSNYYAMVKGDPKVYAIYGFDAYRFRSGSNELCTKNLPQVDLEQLTYFKLVRRDGKTIEIQGNPDQGSKNKDFGLSYLQMTRPYAQTMGINSGRFNSQVLSVLQGLRINQYVDDRPQDLRKYGLAQPGFELFLKDTKNQTLRLLFGNDRDEANLFCKLAQKPAVFTVNKEILRVLELDPFELVDKFVCLFNIDSVDRIIVEATGQQHTLTLSRKGQPARSPQKNAVTATTYRINGKTVAEPLFKTFYRTLIGLFFEAENPDPIMAPAAPEVKITFYLNSGPVREHHFSFVSFNPDFYAIFRNRRSEFLISKDQVQVMLQELETLTH